MILGYLIRKINILLFVFIITGCSSVKNNISNLNQVFLKEEVICPLIRTPEGSEELVANSEINNSGLSIITVLPELSQKDHTLLLYNINNLMDNSALWLTGLLAVGVIAAIQSTSAAFLMTSGSIITRDLYKTYVNKNITWKNELVAVR